MTLHYKFPENITLDEVRNLIRDNHNFIIADKGDYTVVNYVRAGNDTFPNVTDRETSIFRELRGIVFDSKTGEVISRRFHKFFNFGEREDLANVDLSKPHHFLVKLDGSMITPIPLGNHIRWGTKMGITEVAMQAEVFVAKNPKYQEFAKFLIDLGLTPIFEWCSRQQRIVLDYAEDDLILLAIRNNKTGEYSSYPAVKFDAMRFQIPFVERVSVFGDMENIVKQIRSWEDAEGVVLQFEDGHMVKIKADTYVSLHRAKSLLDNERDVVNLILDEKADDLLPLLQTLDKKRLLDFSSDVWHDVTNFSNLVFETLKNNAGKSRKEFALSSEEMSPVLRGMVFANFDNIDSLDANKIFDSIIAYIKKNTSSKSQFEKCKQILVTASWKENDE